MSDRTLLWFETFVWRAPTPRTRCAVFGIGYIPRQRTVLQKSSYITTISDTRTLHKSLARRHTAHHDRAGPASRVYGPLPASAISVSLSARPAPSPPPSRLSVSQRESLPDFLTRRRPPARSPMQHSSCRWRPCPSTESHNTTARRAPPTESAPPQAFSLSLPPPHIPCRGSSPHTDCAHARPCWPALPDRRASRPSRTGLKAPPPRPRRR